MKIKNGVTGIPLARYHAEKVVKTTFRSKFTPIGVQYL